MSAQSCVAQEFWSWKTSILDFALRSTRLTSVHPTVVAQYSVLRITLPSEVIELAGQEVFHSAIPVYLSDPSAGSLSTISQIIARPRHWSIGTWS
jgi:hypothetical protein